jgi:Tol biopolymer transport system component
MIGSRLGPYEVTAKLGAGGMGEVWRATDTRLRREVAIKVLPAAFTADRERLLRFEREAQLLAQLHHPHIASIFGLEQLDGGQALVMELVEGEELAALIARGALPLDEALPIARQIAEALEAAHEQGIVHRDLKPQNVKVRADGTVKVLDFGLAKAMEPAAPPGSGGPVASPAFMQSPTVTGAATALGVILGTAAYMAPEQARGKSIDKRVDIWAFGVVLFEMLTGRRLFAGEETSDVLAAVLRQEIDWAALPAATPPPVRRLLARCLHRDPRQRLRDAGEARIAVEEALAGGGEEAPAIPAAVAPRHRARSIALALLVLAAGVALGALLGAWLRGAPPSPPRALAVALPPGQLLDPLAPPVLSPDGTLLVYGASDAEHPLRLWLRRLDRFDAAPIEGTERGAHPFWSPDSRSLAYFQDDELRRFDLASRSTMVVTKTSALGRGGSWGPDGTILLTTGSNAPISRVAASGGQPRPVTRLDPAILDGSHRYPVWLPDGRHFLFTLWSNHLETAHRVGGIYLGSLEKGLERRLTADLSPPIFAPPDRLLVHRDRALVALAFDPDRREIVEGSGEELAEAPLYSPAFGGVAATASATGDLAFAVASGEGRAQLTWLDRRGEGGALAGFDRLAIAALAIAPDGGRFVAGSTSAAGQDLWVGDLARRVLVRLSRGTVDVTDPVWSPDGTRIAFASESTGTNSVYLQAADGSRPAELLFAEPRRSFRPASWGGDGRHLILTSAARGSVRDEIWLYDFERRQARELLVDPAAIVGEGTLSPDGRWLAYSSDESGNPEIFVRPFPALDRKWKLSEGGGVAPHWRADGGELVFFSPSDRSLRAVAVTARDGALEVGLPEVLFRPSSPLLALAPAPDHSRFLAGVVPGDVRSEPIRVLLGWRGGR